MHSPRTIERAGAVDSRMRTRPSSLTPTAALSGIWGLLLIAFVVAALYFGRSVFVPIALATLITFLTFQVGHVAWSVGSGASRLC